MKRSHFFRIIAILSLFTVNFVNSQTNFWQQTNGPEGGYIRALAVSYSDVVFAGTVGGGVFRSTDNGDNWSYAGLAGSSISSLATSRYGHIFAGNWRSTDDGYTWTPIGVPGGVSAIVVDSSGGVYVGLSVGGEQSSSVYYSSDNGLSWVPLGVGNGPVNALAINASGHVFVAKPLEGILRSTDRGGSWKQINSGLTDLIIFSLLELSGTIFAGSRDGIFRSTDNGESWTKVSPGWVAGVGVQALIATSRGHIYAGLEGYGVARSTDNGITWQQLIPQTGYAGLTQGNILSLAANRSGDVFAGSYSDGVFRLKHSYTQWTQIKKGMTATYVQCLVAGRSGLVFAGTEGGGVFRTRDNGNNWTQSTVGMLYPYIRALAIDSGGRIFAGGGGAGILYLSRDSGATWTQLNFRVWRRSVEFIIVKNTDTIFVATQGDGVFRIVRINDQYYAVPVNVGLTNRVVESLLVDSKGNLLAGTQGGVFRSTNNGDQWNLVGLQNLWVHSLVANASGHLFAGTQGDGIFRSIDDGVNWTPASSGSPRIVSFLSLNSSGHLFAATGDPNSGGGSGQGVFVSTDNGVSWAAFNSGLFNPNVLSLTVSPSDYVFAGAVGSGVFRSTRTSPVVPPPAPMLVSPLNGTTGVSTNPTLSWNPVSEAATYRLQVAKDTSFSTRVVDDSTVTMTSKLVGPLESNTTYYWRVNATNAGGTSDWSSVWSFTTTGPTFVEQVSAEVPATYYLGQNYPNPFNLTTTIAFSLPKQTSVTIVIYNILGTEMAVLLNEQLPAGYYRTRWTPGDLPSGVYFYQLRTQDFKDTKKLLLLR